MGGRPVFGVRRLGRSPYLRPGLGLLAGPLLAAVALAVDAASEPLVVATGNARVLLGSFVGGAISITAFVFWIRGMLVQLTAGQLPPRVVRWYLDDSFLQWTIALILTTFSYSCVVLLMLPADAARPSPGAAVVGGVLLASAALMAVVVTITDSVRSTDESRVLAVLTREAIATVRRRFPSADEQARAANAVPVSDGSPAGTVVAPASGWLNEIDGATLLAAVPEGHTLRVHVGSGVFVAAGSAMATLYGPRADRTDLRPLQATFRVDAERDARRDLHYALGRIVDIAVDQLSGASKTGGHEALMHIGLVLQEAFRRDLSTRVVTGDDRHTVEWCAGLSHQDLLAEVVQPLHEKNAVTSPVAVTLLRALGLVARDLHEHDVDGERHAVLEREARRVLASLRHDDDAWGPSEDPRRVAIEEGLIPDAPVTAQARAASDGDRDR